MFRTPAELKAIEANGHLLNVQSLALSVSNLTEGHVGAPQFVLAKQEYQDAGNYQRTQAAIAEHTKNLWLTQRTNDLTLIREQANDVAADVRLDAARSGLETAYATLMASLGEEAVPASMGQQSLAELAESIKKLGTQRLFEWKQKGGRQSMRHSWCIRGMVLVLLVPWLSFLRQDGQGDQGGGLHYGPSMASHGESSAAAQAILCPSPGPRQHASIQGRATLRKAHTLVQIDCDKYQAEV